MIISIVGVDGSGKTTVCNKICSMLLKNNFKAECLKVNPFYEEGYKYYKNVLVELDKKDTKLQERLLEAIFTLDTYKYINSNISDEKDKIYICDRYIETTSALFEGLKLGGELYRDTMKYLPKADETFFLDVTTEVAEQRIYARDNIKNGLNKHVSDAIVNYYRSKEYTIIDGSKPLDDVINQIVTYLKDKYDIFKHLNSES